MSTLYFANFISLRNAFIWRIVMKTLAVIVLALFIGTSGVYACPPGYTSCGSASCCPI